MDEGCRSESTATGHNFGETLHGHRRGKLKILAKLSGKRTKKQYTYFLFVYFSFKRL